MTSMTHRESNAPSRKVGIYSDLQASLRLFSTLSKQELFICSFYFTASRSNFPSVLKKCNLVLRKPDFIFRGSRSRG